MMSASGRSVSMPIRKLRPNEIRLHSSMARPARPEQYSDPRCGLGMKKPPLADTGPIESGGEQDIEIEKGERRNQEIRPVDVAEFHRFDPLPFQEKDSGQDHSQHENDRQCSKIFWHPSPLRCIAFNKRLPDPLSGETPSPAAIRNIGDHAHRPEKFCAVCPPIEVCR